MEEDQELMVMKMVPPLIREDNDESDDYEPKVVSLGPYHHGKEKLKLVEKFKPKAVKWFIGDKNEEDFMNAILRDIEYARSCYLREITSRYSDEEFARMLLRDSCVILNCIGLTKREESLNRLRMTNSLYLGPVIYTGIRRDMLLLENQVPFKILMTLSVLRYDIDGATFLAMMETSCFRMFFDGTANIEKPSPTNNLGTEPLHLLEIFRRVVVMGVEPYVDRGRLVYHPCNINNLVSCIENCCGCRDIAHHTRGRYTFRSVTVLKSKGIHFTASKINSLKGVEFSSTQYFQPATLKLPIWKITIYTRVFFKNMIAYELSRCFSVPMHVTAYVSLMKLLVVKEEDAKELRDEEIIINELGSDKQVVQLYSGLNVYGTDDIGYFSHVKEGIQEHYKSKIKMWMAELRTTYFGNPWSIIAFAAAILALFLTILQTYYSAYSDDDKCCAKPK